MQRARREALKALQVEFGIGLAHHQVEIFVMEPGTDRYLGRLCEYATCPKGKDACLTPRCGERPFLKVIEGFRLRDNALHPAFSICLHDTGLHSRPDKQTLLHPPS